MTSPGTLLHTIRHLRPVQIYSRLYRPKPRVRRTIEVWRRPVTGNWVQSVTRPSGQIAEGKFRFLNQEREIRTWNDAGLPKLWLYNLHYFENPSAELVDRWIAENPVGAGNGWEPYPLAFRIVNWIKWALNGAELSESAVCNLQSQAAYLSQTLEHHLGANHLFANAVALAIAGLFFEGSDAEAWLAEGTRLLERELHEQVLPDGGHYERSPMYHALILESLLDVINIARRYSRQCALWVEKAGAMLSWLGNMVHPDGRISFFNDATFGIAPEPAELQDYASRLNIKPADLTLSSSGYMRLEQGETVLLFDAGPVGPDHQPGHAHADTLSLELSHRNRRLLVNSGISTYEKGADRQWQRGTAAHNTLKIDGVDQSEVWSAFRVARRARPLNVRTDGKTFVEAAHDGYRRLGNPLIHRRRVDLRPSELIITDEIEGRGHHQLELFFHFHPDVNPTVMLDPKLTAQVLPTVWYPAFNMSVPNTTAVGTWTGQCPVRFETLIPLS